MIKLGELVMILDLHRSVGHSAIGRQLGVDREQLGRHRQRVGAAGLQKAGAKAGIVDHFETYLRDLSRAHRRAVVA